MSCLVEDFRFCLLIGVGGFWFLKGEGEKKGGVRKAGRGKNKPTELQSCTEPKLGFNGCYSRRAWLGSLRRENGVVLEKYSPAFI